MKDKTFRLATIFGIMEPVFYFLLITTLSLMRPDYKLSRGYISELSGRDSPHRHVTSLSSFILLGMSIILVGSALHEVEKNYPLSKTSLTLLTITGASLIFLGIIPADGQKTTSVGKYHRILTLPTALAMPGAMLVNSNIFSKDKRWGKSWANFSEATAWATIILGWLILKNKHTSKVGLVQRVAFAPSLLWTMAISNKMRQLQDNH